MDLLTIAIVILIAVWLIAAIIYSVRHRGGACCGDCENCAKNTRERCADSHRDNEKIKRCKGRSKRDRKGF